MILFSDIIKEVIDQQSTLYDNVNIVANFFKYEQVRLNWNLYMVYSFTSVLRQNYMYVLYIVMMAMPRTQYVLSYSVFSNTCL